MANGLSRSGLSLFALFAALPLSGCFSEDALDVKALPDPVEALDSVSQWVKEQTHLEPLPDALAALNTFKRANTSNPHLYWVAKDVVEMKVAHCQLTYNRQLVEDVIQNSVVFSVSVAVANVDTRDNVRYKAFIEALEQTVDCTNDDQRWLDAAQLAFTSTFKYAEL